MNNSFDSIDRLLEFGMSMAVAQQMMRTMNHAITNMPMAGSGTQFIVPQPQLYYVVVDGVQSGPMTEEEIQQLVVSGHITKETLLWKPGTYAWVLAESMPEIHKIIMLNKKEQL